MQNQNNNLPDSWEEAEQQMRVEQAAAQQQQALQPDFFGQLQIDINQHQNAPAARAPVQRQQQQPARVDEFTPDDFKNWEERVIGTDRVVDLKQDLDFVCPICYNLLSDPVDCITCDTSFCKKCINDYIQRQQQMNHPITCPIGCQQITTKPVHKKVRNKLNELMIKCIFAPKCPEQFPLSHLNEHETNNCQYNRIKCQNFDTCKSYFKIQHRADHLKVCQAPQQEFRCGSCQAAPFDKEVKLAFHQYFECDGRADMKVACVYCQQVMTKKEMLNNHNAQYCPFITSHVSTLNDKLSHIQEELRVKDAKINELQNRLIHAANSSQNVFSGAKQQVFSVQQPQNQGLRQVLPLQNQNRQDQQVWNQVLHAHSAQQQKPYGVNRF